MRIFLQASCVALGLAVGGSALGQAHIHPAPTAGVAVHACWVRLMPAGLPSAAYFRLENSGSTDAALTQVKTDAYAHVMLHATRESQGMSQMHHVDAVPVPAHGAVDFAPGGYHVMLENATRALQVGQAIALTFAFAPSAAPVTVDCAVRAANAVQEPAHAHHHHQH